MKAIIYEKYGPPEVLKIVDWPKPTPKADEVLIRVRATTVTIGDVRMRSFTVPRAQWLPARLYLGIFKPRRKILGMELAGDIEAVGADVTRFKVGDAVFGSTFEANFGGYAEYKCLPQDSVIALKPAKLSYVEAAAAFGGPLTALHCLQRANIQPGQSVLIYGASGAVGTNAVQIAKHHFGAEVTGVCSTANLELVKSLGADHVIDYTQEDFTERGQTYDVIFDAVAKFPPARAKKALKTGGVYRNAHQHSDAGPKARHEAFRQIIALIEADKLKPMIDKCYPMADIVAAHHYVQTGHKRGNVGLLIAPDGDQEVR